MLLQNLPQLVHSYPAADKHSGDIAKNISWQLYMLAAVEGNIC
jgi:hypothetical protein